MPAGSKTRHDVQKNGKLRSIRLTVPQLVSRSFSTPCSPPCWSCCLLCLDNATHGLRSHNGTPRSSSDGRDSAADCRSDPGSRLAYRSRASQDPVDETKALTSTPARQLMRLPRGDDVIAFRDRAILRFCLSVGVLNIHHKLLNYRLKSLKNLKSGTTRVD